MKLTLEELQRKSVERSEAPDGYGTSCSHWSPPEWLQALVGELGEACNKLKKRRRGEVVPQESIEEEFGDVQIYLAMWASSLGIDLAKVTVEKFNRRSEEMGCSIKLQGEGFHLHDDGVMRDHKPESPS